jgi:hypothetical protein
MRSKPPDVTIAILWSASVRADPHSPPNLSCSSFHGDIRVALSRIIGVAPRERAPPIRRQFNRWNAQRRHCRRSDWRSMSRPKTSNHYQRTDDDYPKTIMNHRGSPCADRKSIASADHCKLAAARQDRNSVLSRTISPWRWFGLFLAHTAQGSHDFKTVLDRRRGRVRGRLRSMSEFCQNDMLLAIVYYYLGALIAI